MKKNIEDLEFNYRLPAFKPKDEVWEQLQQRVKSHQPAKVEKNRGLNWWIGSAAAAAIFIGILWVGMFSTGKYSPDVHAPVASAKNMILPDSSKVSLVSNSVAKYHYNQITGERNVVLKGEAFFEVKKGRKFTVDFDGGSVKVLGTSFDVTAYSKNLTEIACNTGRVEVSLAGKKYKITAGQGIKCYKNKITGPYAVDTVDIRSRQQGLFNWKRVPMDELMELIGSRFDYTVQLSDVLKQRNFTGKVELNNLEESIMIIAFAMDVDYTIDKEHKLITLNEK